MAFLLWHIMKCNNIGTSPLNWRHLRFSWHLTLLAGCLQELYEWMQTPWQTSISSSKLPATASTYLN
jgi:hypothetical protein